MKKKEPRLTLKTAKAVAEKVLGFSKGLYKDTDVTNFDLYKMQMGMISVRIQIEHFCFVSVCISGGCTGTIYMYFDPVTLEEDYYEESIQMRKEHHVEFDEWVDANGPELCHKLVDESWNKNRV